MTEYDDISQYTDDTLSRYFEVRTKEDIERVDQIMNEIE